MIAVSLVIVTFVLGAAVVSNAFAIGGLNRRIRFLETLARNQARAASAPPAPTPPVRAPEPQGAYRTAGEAGSSLPYVAPLARWRNLVIKPSDVRLGGCTAHFEYTTDDNVPDDMTTWLTSTAYSSAFDEDSIRAAVEKNLRSIVETQRTAAALTNGVVSQAHAQQIESSP